ncbi:hypothetical protein GCM10007874_42960 [Labrys miyagiensis]|uniref:Uncharacterized protein n=1 Tax=Labrys miyagiensis TaxID=346912 RepID=A0ABQ6CM76_9HYPH|nr:hypothetical protein GCM10007874_42960 [Labrys miyagiensis]
MHVIGHDAPSPKPITLAIERQQRPFYEISDFGDFQPTGPAASIKLSLDTSSIELVGSVGIDGIGRQAVRQAKRDELRYFW